MRVVITGGVGFIGSHLCRKLLNENHEVYCVDNLLTGSKSNITDLLSNPQFHFVQHDVINPLPEIPPMHALFHLASPASPNHHSSISYHALPMETMLVNTVGTLELIKRAEKDNALFLFASTSEVYGNPLEHPQKETYCGNVSTIGPRSVYDESKRFGETLVAHFVRKHNVNARIARIFNTYGPFMMFSDKRMVIAFIEQALKNMSIPIFGDGKQTRSLCYIDDTVEGLCKLMFSPHTKGEVVNIGTDEEHTVLDFAHLIIKLTQSSSSIEFSEKLPQDDPVKRKPDIQKARRLLSWKPKTPLEEGLHKTIAYFKRSL